MKIFEIYCPYYMADGIQHFVDFNGFETEDECYTTDYSESEFSAILNRYRSDDVGVMVFFADKDRYIRDYIYHPQMHIDISEIENSFPPDELYDQCTLEDYVFFEEPLMEVRRL